MTTISDEQTAIIRTERGLTIAGQVRASPSTTSWTM